MEKVFVGKIVNTHGIKGEIKIKSDFERKTAVFKVGNLVIINDNTYEITAYRIHKGLDMITLKGFNDINQVLPFKGLNLFIDRDLLGLKDDEYILEDLIGMKVVLNNQELGIIEDYTNDINPLLFVKGEKDFCIPIKGDFIDHVDKGNHEIRVREEAKGLIL